MPGTPGRESCPGLGGPNWSWISPPMTERRFAGVVGGEERPRGERLLAGGGNMRRRRSRSRDPCRCRRPGGFARLSPSSPPRLTLSPVLGYFIRPTPYSAIVCQLATSLAVLTTSLLTLTLAFDTLFMRAAWPCISHESGAGVIGTCMRVSAVVGIVYLAGCCTHAATRLYTACLRPGFAGEGWQCPGR
jgi:hypothetical protein